MFEPHSCRYNDKTHPELAMRYNDISVLENFHAYQCFDIMQFSPTHNVFAKLPPDQFKEVRKITVEVEKREIIIPCLSSPNFHSLRS